MNFLKLIIVGLISLSAFAGVNLKNGNFYVSYTDIIVPGDGKDIEITRTYNSRATIVGIFGFGWGSDFETRLEDSTDGSVIVHENGSGARTRFIPRQKIDPVAGAKKIVEAVRKKSNGTLNKKEADKLLKKLSNNAFLRQEYERNYDIKASVPIGTKLYSNTRGLQTLEKTSTGYKRLLPAGREDFFDNKGRLIEMKSKGGYKISLNYNKSGKIKSVKDSYAKQLFFEHYANGRVKHIWSAGDKKTFYKYDEKGNMIESKDVGDNTFKYVYDSNHNLLDVIYKDGSKYKIRYEGKTQFVSSITTKNGEVTKYKYESNPKNPDFHYWTYVTKTNAAGKDVKNKYEYEIKTRPDGSQYTYRILTAINNTTTETIYSECCNLPLKIARGKDVTTFEYNKEGLLTKKTSTKGDFVKLDYNKENKVVKVVNNDGWTKFDYEKGNLKKAISSTGKSVLLRYDRKGQITKMMDYSAKNKKMRSLVFEYNSLGKPVEISMSDVGKINVSYDNYGEIKKVESKAGYKIALEVTQAFQSLISIVKPAGVNLNL